MEEIFLYLEANQCKESIGAVSSVSKHLNKYQEECLQLTGKEDAKINFFLRKIQEIDCFREQKDDAERKDEGETDRDGLSSYQKKKKSTKSTIRKTVQPNSNISTSTSSISTTSSPLRSRSPQKSTGDFVPCLITSPQQYAKAYMRTRRPRRGGTTYKTTGYTSADCSNIEFGIDPNQTN